MAEVYLVTGDLESGKTSLCLDLFQAALEAGLQVGGVVSPAVFEGEAKTAIDVLDLKSGSRKRLAGLVTDQKTGLETRRWAFFPEAVEWGNQVLAESVPCDLLIIDELGPLEFHRQEGWMNGFSALESGDYQLAFAVIRPSLVDEASERWQVSGILDLDLGESARLIARDILKSLKPD